jgi:hypothetical protein
VFSVPWSDPRLYNEKATVTEFSGAVFEEAKIMDITEIVLNLMEQNGH